MSTAPSRAWKFPTSPRSPYKIKPELKLLLQLQDMIWNKETQLKFAKLLAESEDYKGEVSEKETDFAARDRLRGPSILGFIRKPDVNDPRLRITEVGNYFVNCEVHEEEFIFQRQIAKVQFGSPATRKNVERSMNIRPMGLMIKILKEVKQLTKDEIALYCLTTTNYSEVDETIELILENRNSVAKTKDLFKRKNLRLSQKSSRLEKIYYEDLNEGNTQLREGGKGFLETKYRTLRDFADSSIRYLISTGLFSTNYHRQTFQLVKMRTRESDFLLDSYGLSIDNDPNSSYSEYIDKYLGNPDSIEIWRDRDENQAKDAMRLIEFIQTSDKKTAMRFDSEYIHASTKIERLGILSSLEQKSMEINRKMESISIRENLAMSYPDIKNTFDEILTLRNSMIDKPLILEWNTWRLFNLVPDSESIVGNFLSDADGNPLRTASGGIADIVCEFREFWLVIEVTLQSGMKQYETEGEPITRHVGNHIRKLREIGDVRPVYGLFVAEKINKELLFYLNAISWRESQHYGGKIQIYPIEISKLINIFDEVNFEDFTSNKILSSFSLIFSETLQSLGEIDWQTRGHEILIQEFSKGGD